MESTRPHKEELLQLAKLRLLANRTPYLIEEPYDL
jgi:hypothetical protein